MGAKTGRALLTLIFGLSAGVAAGMGPGCSNGDVPCTEEVAPMRLTSAAFAAGDSIPVLYTCDGNDISPPLAWTPAPEGTASIALTCTDPDAPSGTFVHWVLFNLPLGTTELPEGFTTSALPAGAAEGVNDFPKIGYGGPCPPPGAPHRYYFRVYALDAVLDLRSGARIRELTRSMEGHILAEGMLMGRYGRK